MFGHFQVYFKFIMNIAQINKSGLSLVNVLLEGVHGLALTKLKPRKLLGQNLVLWILHFSCPYWVTHGCDIATQNVLMLSQLEMMKFWARPRDPETYLAEPNKSARIQEWANLVQTFERGSILALKRPLDRELSSFKMHNEWSFLVTFLNPMLDSPHIWYF